MGKARRRFEDQIVHTGQHYDDSMSQVFFDELDIPRPAANLGIGSSSQGAQTARMLEALERFLLEARPDVVVVYGDTNSTLAGALAAAKLHIPVVHVEAGLRSFNRRMPEELNRIVTDHLSTLLCAPTRTAMTNLAAEGLLERSRLTGDVMFDAVLFNARRAADRSDVLGRLKLTRGSYAVATVHRAENTAAPALRPLLSALNAASASGRIVFPVHPRTLAVMRGELSDWRPAANLQLVDPLGYLDMLALVEAASCVLTDSGGLQKEAFFLGRPCVTLRNETEWLETLTDGANVIAGSDGARLTSLLSLQASRVAPTKQPGSGAAGPFGNGDAARSVVDAICDLCELPQ
jgi:UDP-N-acetylglucosamine 2-epimerase